jgi:hypothetical protein
MAAGLRDNRMVSSMAKQGSMKGIDNFYGYSCDVFPEYKDKGLDDLEIFNSQVSMVSGLVQPCRANLLVPGILEEVSIGIEIAHIDAAKTIV